MKSQRSSERDNYEFVPLYAESDLTDHARQKRSREKKLKKKSRNKWNHEK
jgi:hypothetical protein